jgi:hypothetical protein
LHLLPISDWNFACTRRTHFRLPFGEWEIGVGADYEIPAATVYPSCDLIRLLYKRGTASDCSLQGNVERCGSHLFTNRTMVDANARRYAEFVPLLYARLTTGQASEIMVKLSAECSVDVLVGLLAMKFARIETPFGKLQAELKEFLWRVGQLRQTLSTAANHIRQLKSAKYSWLLEPENHWQIDAALETYGVELMEGTGVQRAVKSFLRRTYASDDYWIVLIEAYVRQRTLKPHYAWLEVLLRETQDLWRSRYPGVTPPDTLRREASGYNQWMLEKLVKSRRKFYVQEIEMIDLVAAYLSPRLPREQAPHDVELAA